MKRLSEVIKKFANIPTFNEPTKLSTFINCAGVEVMAAKAIFSSKPYSIALRRFAIKSAFDFKLALVKAKFTPAFDNKEAFAGAISQCFISAKETTEAS